MWIKPTYMDISQNIFRDAYRDGISTLRLLHYPKNTAQLSKEEEIPDRIHALRATLMNRLQDRTLTAAY